MRDFPIHTGLSILTTGLLLFALRWAPGGTPLPVGTAPPPAPSANVHAGAGALPAKSPALAAPLLADSGGVLDRFYSALARTQTGAVDAVTRVVHYGDSPTTADLITGDVRALLQAQFGDAGHGFILVAKPWAWYQHTDVQLSGTGWQMLPATRFEARDGFFGLGGVTFTGAANASSRIVFDKGRYTRFELWFLRQPDGGTAALSAGGVTLDNIDASAPTKAPDFAVLQVSGGASSVELRVTRGHVRVFGVSAERPGPGVVYDSLGLNGASITVMTRIFNQAHWAAELQHRNPDLLVVNYGANEADFADFVDKQYEKELREAIGRLHAALPQTSLLIMSPMDRGHRTGPGQIATMPTIPKIVEIQRRVAGETGCGFFDTFQAMGGEGTMARWYAAQPRLVSADFLHPYPAGGKLVAQAFVRQLLLGLRRYEQRHASEVR